MSYQQTSLLAYTNAKKGLGKKQLAVYDYLLDNGPLCNQEIAYGLGWPINSVTPRVNELAAKANIKEAFRDVYPKTGRKVIYWDIDHEFTLQPEPKTTRSMFEGLA